MAGRCVAHAAGPDDDHLWVAVAGTEVLIVGTTGRDSAGHDFVEFAMSHDEQVRVTYIPHQDWAKGPTIRIQKHAHTGRMSQGPEFPAEKSMDLIAAVSELLTSKS
jgi:hypothetical protein